MDPVDDSTPVREEFRQLREVPAPPRSFTHCLERDGKTPRQMRRVPGGTSTRPVALPGGGTRQRTYAVTVFVCELCGHRERVEREV